MMNTEEFIVFFVWGQLAVIVTFVLYSLFKILIVEKFPSLFPYIFEMLLLIELPLILYLGLMDFDDRQVYNVFFSIPFLEIILTILFIIYFELAERLYKVKLSVFIILTYFFVVFTWFFYPRKGLGF
ncbi:hypothetical protein B1H38_12285 [Leptospira borgpetersenii serovar Ballum]|nr:hypothetical protein B1H38_12285 [Leptospira borgpetersenii serovar Ballum]